MLLRYQLLFSLQVWSNSVPCAAHYYNMEYFIIAGTAFFAAILTFFSGFGLGTILTPVFMVFFPVDLAIGLTGVVHLFNNIFKLFLVGKKGDREVVLKFGVPAILAAIVGAWLLLNIPDTTPLFTYEWFSKTYEIYLVKLIISILLFVFALIDLFPQTKNIQFDKNKLPIGGVLSGFFGGLSGNQGALRSAFLIKAGMTKEAFIGTSVIVSSLVDFSRIGVYATRFTKSGLVDNLNLVMIATLAAVFGAFLGNKLLKKVTLRNIQVTVAILLLFLSVCLGLGWL